MVHFMKRKFLNQTVDLSVVDLAQLQTTIFPLTSKDWLIIQTKDDIWKIPKELKKEKNWKQGLLLVLLIGLNSTGLNVCQEARSHWVLGMVWQASSIFPQLKQTQGAKNYVLGPNLLWSRLPILCPIHHLACPLVVRSNSNPCLHCWKLVENIISPEGCR